MTSMFLSSNGPSDLRVVANPTSSSTYQFYCSYGTNGSITRLHFSMIVFDQADVQASGKYMLVYERI